MGFFDELAGAIVGGLVGGRLARGKRKEGDAFPDPALPPGWLTMAIAVCFGAGVVLVLGLIGYGLLTLAEG